MFRPLMLSHAIEDADWAGLSPRDFVAEWKWDGIRVQIAAAAGEVRIFSRAGDDISASFPEIVAAFQPSTRCSTASCWSCATARSPPSTICSSASTARP